MKIILGPEVESNIPVALVYALYNHYDDATTGRYVLNTMKRFYKWCKKFCSIDFLFAYVIENEGISLRDRRMITSYLTSKHCPSTRMTPEERSIVIAIRDKQIAIRKEITHKRARTDRELQKESMKDKERRIMNTESSRKELCVYTQTGIISADIIGHCLSFCEFRTTWNVRNVCKGFFNGYLLARSHIQIHKVSDTVMVKTLKKIACYCADLPSYPDKEESFSILKAVRKYYSKIVTFRNDKKDTLASARLVSLGKACVPLLRFLYDRIFVYYALFTDDIYGRHIIPCSEILHAISPGEIDLHKKCCGISLELAEHPHLLYSVQNIKKITTNIDNVQQLHIVCSIQSFIYIFNNILSYKILFPTVETLYIESTYDIYSGSCMDEDTWKLFDTHIKIVFPNIKTIVLMGVSDVPILANVSIVLSEVRDPSEQYNPALYDRIQYPNLRDLLESILMSTDTCTELI